MNATVQITTGRFQSGNRFSLLEMMYGYTPVIRIYCYVDGPDAGEMWGDSIIWCSALANNNRSLEIGQRSVRRLVEDLLGPFDFARPALAVAA